MPPSILSASAVNFSYGSHRVLRDVSISLSAGEVVALLGPNGSGKSTLIKTLFGYLSATGNVAWIEKSIDEWSKTHLAKLVAYLPQAPVYEPDQRVIDVLKLGRAPYWKAFGVESQADVDAVKEVAHLLDLHDLLRRPMDALSGGQRQRVFLGRCLAQQPKALLLDEPSTFLDLRHQVELGQLVQKLARERRIGVLMASHDLNLSAAFADRMVLLNDGAVVASGKPADVLNPELLSEVYGLAMESARLSNGQVMVVPTLAGPRVLGEA